ncbi:MAG: integration host factor subunit beta [Verrucomicrobia bacterium]|nr:integration host factor subunit beta [Verrucomicrobiota bacterium]MCF7708886.1 integration host factor subunit beta [Verrucomicrobiota bacterium]
MTKRELIYRISNETGIVQQDVANIIQMSLDYITESLVAGERVEFRNFGVFDVKVRKPRVGRNPIQPEKDVPIPKRAVVRFRAGKEMRNDVAKLTEGKKGNSKAAGKKATKRVKKTPKK